MMCPCGPDQRCGSGPPQHLVANLHLLEHRGILDAEDHRHVVVFHVEVLDRTAGHGDLPACGVDLLDLAFHHRLLRGGGERDEERKHEDG